MAAPVQYSGFDLGVFLIFMGAETLTQVADNMAFHAVFVIKTKPETLLDL